MVTSHGDQSMNRLIRHTPRLSHDTRLHTSQGEVRNKWCCWGFLEVAQGMAASLLLPLRLPPLILIKKRKAHSH